MFPEPPSGARPFNVAASVTLDANQRGTITFTPEARRSEFVIPVVAASKKSDSTYEVHTDDTNVYGQDPIPPTDIDDIYPVWMPPRTFHEELKIIVRNTGSTNGRTYNVQAVGWEALEGQ